MNTLFPAIIISGATATGKTSTSYKIADQALNLGYSPVIVNFDSLLFYQELDIGVAKPPLQYLNKYHHELVSFRSIAEPLNAAQFNRMATPILQRLKRENKLVILVGGSAFYIRALIKGMYQQEKEDEGPNLEIKELYQKEGIEPVRELLKTLDPTSYQSLHPNDHYRIIRAASFSQTFRRPFSNERKKFEDLRPYDFSIHQWPDWNFLHVNLLPEKFYHWRIIEERTYQMLKDGLIDEVRGLIGQGFSPELRPLQSIGYKETIDYLDGKIENTEQLGKKIIFATRRLAKSQKTFFKKISPKNIYRDINSKVIEKDVSTFLHSQP